MREQGPDSSPLCLSRASVFQLVRLRSIVIPAIQTITETLTKGKRIRVRSVSEKPDFVFHTTGFLLFEEAATVSLIETITAAQVKA
jgi:hypothetical protein